MNALGQVWVPGSGVAVNQGDRHDDPAGGAALQFVVGTALVLPLGIGFEAPSLGAVRLALPVLILLGVVSTALAFGLQTWAQRFVAAGAYLLLNEQTPLRGLTGAGLILMAIVLVVQGDKTLPPHRPVDHAATVPAIKQQILPEQSKPARHRYAKAARDGAAWRRWSTGVRGRYPRR